VNLQNKEESIMAKPAEAKKVAREKRPSRIPLGANRDVLTVEGVPEGYVGRWVNDDVSKNRIPRALDGGYEFVTDNGDIFVGDSTVDNMDAVRRGTRPKSGSVKCKNVGNGVVAYFMAIRKDWYEEDQKAKQDEIDANEADIFRKLTSGSDGTYGDVNKF